MNQVIVDPALASKLREKGVTVDICDENGTVLGHFVPIVPPAAYENVEIPISEEELDRREKEGGGRPLAEILADLESGQ
jgi:hypothetical protein